MEGFKSALKHVYGYFTDEQNEGDFMKMAGAFLMLASVFKFLFNQPFDPIAFGAGAGAFATSKALDKIQKKGA